MNKHLLETKLRSITHYDNELNRLKEAASINREVRAELVSSLVEYFPFIAGDIIMKGESIYKIKNVNNSGITGTDEIYFAIEYYPTSNYCGFDHNNTRTLSINYNDLSSWKKIN